MVAQPCLDSCTHELVLCEHVVQLPLRWLSKVLQNDFAELTGVPYVEETDGLVNVH